MSEEFQGESQGQESYRESKKKPLVILRSPRNSIIFVREYHESLRKFQAFAQEFEESLRESQEF